MTLITTDNQHYTDIASAIRSKAGVQDLFKPSEMAAAVLAIPTGGSAVLGSKAITQNGTYYASADSLDGYSYVDVNVSGGSSDFDAFIQGTMSELTNGTALYVGSSVFVNNSKIESVNMGGVLSVYDYAFSNCQKLKTAIFKACTDIFTQAFRGCLSIKSLDFPECVHIGQSAFALCSMSLSYVNFPKCTTIGSSAFAACYSLVEVSFPECVSIKPYAFNGCSKLSAVSFPSCTTIENAAFSRCYALSVAEFPICESINGAFASCYNLLSLYLTSINSVPSLDSYAFNSTPIGGYTASTGGQYGSVFVPSSLYAAFISATNWSLISDRIVSV